MNIETIREDQGKLIGKMLHTASRRAGFQLTAINANSIIIQLSSGKDRPIPATQFNSMCEQWPDYKAGRVTRTELANGTPKNFNTSYIESILKELENPS